MGAFQRKCGISCRGCLSSACSFLAAPQSNIGTSKRSDGKLGIARLALLSGSNVGAPCGSSKRFRKRNRQLVDEKFYGDALKEAESGVRRDDIWAKALANSNGDLDRIRSIYIELLAQHFSKTKTAQRRTASITLAKSRLKSFATFLIASAIVITVAVLSLNALYSEYTDKWLVNYGNTLQINNQYEPRRLLARDGTTFMEPTVKELWDVQLAQYGLKSTNDFSQVQMNLYRMGPSQLYGVYGESATTLIGSIASVSGLMRSAQPPSMWEALLSGFRVR